MYLQYSFDNKTHLVNHGIAVLSIKVTRNFKTNRIKIYYLLIY